MGLKTSLCAREELTFRLDPIPSLLDPDNDALIARLEPARRLVAVTDEATDDRREPLQEYLRAWELRGRLSDHLGVRAAPSDGLDELEETSGICALSAQWRLGRRDLFMAFGGARLARVVGLASAMFRRYTASIAIHRDLAAVLESVRQGHRVVLADGVVSVVRRAAHIVVDVDGLVRPGCLRPDERWALLLMALLDPPLLELLTGAAASSPRDLRRGGLDALVRLSRRFGPGHDAWRLDRPWLPLMQTAGGAVRAEDRAASALLLSARVAALVGVLELDRSRRLETVAGRLGVAVPEGAVMARALDGAWPAPGHGAIEMTAVPLPASPDRGDVVLVERPSRRLPPRPARSRPAPARELTYDVRFVGDLFAPGDESLRSLWEPGARLLLVVDDYPHVPADRMRAYLEAERERGRLASYAVRRLPCTPATKTMDFVVRLLRELAAWRLGPRDRIVVVGGGAVMDVVGHAAFLYGGETPYIRVPTTLVGMIDAGVGLKVGVNLGDRKNMLGGYHPPLACLCDVGFLRTLPVEEVRCGLSEAIKMALVRDARLFELIEASAPELLCARPSAHLQEVLLRSISAMLHELESNPFEHELRRLPDFGHELGQVIEARSDYRLRHGEAVAIGMALSCHLAVATGRLARADMERILALFLALGLPIHDATCRPQPLWCSLREEVLPHKGGMLHLVVPTTIGTGGFIDSIDELTPAMLEDACDELRLRMSEGG